MTVVDPTNSTYVNIYQFSMFLSGFGPIEVAYDNFRTKLLDKPWFHGTLSHVDACRLLESGILILAFSILRNFRFPLSRNRPHFQMLNFRDLLRYVLTPICRVGRNLSCAFLSVLIGTLCRHVQTRRWRCPRHQPLHQTRHPRSQTHIDHYFVCFVFPILCHFLTACSFSVLLK